MEVIIEHDGDECSDECMWFGVNYWCYLFGPLTAVSDTAAGRRSECLCMAQPLEKTS